MSFFTNIRADRFITELKEATDVAAPQTQKAIAKLRELGPGAIEPVTAALADADKIATVAYIEVLTGLVNQKTFPKFIESMVTGSPRVVAGVAWAPNRGISKVEVRLGAGADWVEAELSEPLSDNSWRQWVVQWEATAGTYQIQVRATDGEGNVQTDELRPPAPDGATGWHTIEVDVA